MSETHIHLLVTHLPIFGSMLGALVLLYGIWAKSDKTNIAAYGLFIISAIGAGISYFTGEDAEEAVENIQGITKSSIETHEDFAMFALISLIVLGVASIAGIYITIKKAQYSGKSAIIILIIAVISFILVGRTGYLGGQIRHTEIGPDAPPVNHSEHDED